MFVEIVRLFIVVLAVAGGYWLGRDLGGAASGAAGIGAMLGCLAGYVGGGVLGRLVERAVGACERRVDRLPPAQVVAGALGAVAGGVGGALLVLPLALLAPRSVSVPLGGLLVWIGGFAGFRVVGRQSAAVFEMLGLSTRPLVRARPYDATDGFLVDTSVVMDGQLLAFAHAGLLGADLLVPRFVLDELQGLADAADGPRSRRARRGLETLEALKHDGPMRLFVVDDEVPEHGAVDAKLVTLARRLELRLLTNDGALAQVAEVQGVPTCNLRRLASDLAPPVTPGEFVRVALTKPGREPGQGVGYLDDGSMVVVNGGDTLVGGPAVALRVASVVPTAVGRLVFASVEPTGEDRAAG